MEKERETTERANRTAGMAQNPTGNSNNMTQPVGRDGGDDDDGGGDDDNGDDDDDDEGKVKKDSDKNVNKTRVIGIQLARKATGLSLYSYLSCSS